MPVPGANAKGAKCARPDPKARPRSHSPLLRRLFDLDEQVFCVDLLARTDMQLEVADLMEEKSFPELSRGDVSWLSLRISTVPRLMRPVAADHSGPATPNLSPTSFNGPSTVPRGT